MSFFVSLSVPSRCFTQGFIVVSLFRAFSLGNDDVMQQRFDLEVMDRYWCRQNVSIIFKVVSNHSNFLYQFWYILDLWRIIIFFSYENISQESMVPFKMINGPVFSTLILNSNYRMKFITYESKNSFWNCKWFIDRFRKMLYYYYFLNQYFGLWIIEFSYVWATFINGKRLFIPWT